MSHSSKVCREVYLQSNRLVPDPHPLGALIQASREKVPCGLQPRSQGGASGKGTHPHTLTSALHPRAAPHGLCQQEPRAGSQPMTT